MKIIKRIFKNKDLKNTFILSIMFTILFLITKWSVFLIAPLIFIFILPIFIFVEYDSSKEEERIKNIKERTSKYKTYSLSKEKFIEECQSGLLHSIVKINGNIYELEVQVDKVNSNDYKKFICYINDIEIKGLNNFLNHKLDNQTCLNDLEKIEFLEYNETDPRKYFKEKTI